MIVQTGDDFIVLGHESRGPGSHTSEIFRLGTNDRSGTIHGRMPVGVLVHFLNTTNNVQTNVCHVTLRAQLTGSNVAFRYGPEIEISFLNKFQVIPILFHPGAVATGNVRAVPLPLPVSWQLRVDCPGSSGAFTGTEDWALTAVILN